ncbi:MAG: flavin reductase [Clostridia bacterium]|nr:flavin reductase [Clostridia bacterium]
MDWMKETNEQLRRGAFLMVNGNPMTIGWGQFGVIWNKQTFSVYVRQSRYTHSLLEHASTFTVSVPKAGTMKDDLAFCGTRSGRDVDKISALHASLLPAAFGGQDGFSGCRYHIECRILFRTELDEHLLEDDSLLSRYYADGDPHTMYVGEILGVREENA